MFGALLLEDRVGPVTRYRLARTALGRAMYWTAAYRLGGLVIDSGCAAAAAELVKALRGGPAEAVALTHHHEDHVGGAAALERELNLALFAPEGALEAVAAPPRLEPYRRLVWLRPAPCRPEPLGDSLTVGQDVFRVVPAPGHCPDQVVLFHPATGSAFCGDLFIGFRPKMALPGEDIGQTIASLRRLVDLKPTALYTGLGRVIDDPAVVLPGLIDYLTDLRRRAKDMAARGDGLKRITRRLVGRENKLAYLSRGHVSKANFVKALLKDDQPN